MEDYHYVLIGLTGLYIGFYNEINSFFKTYFFDLPNQNKDNIFKDIIDSFKRNNNIETNNGLNKIYFNNGKSNIVQYEFYMINGLKNGLYKEYGYNSKNEYKRIISGSYKNNFKIGKWKVIKIITINIRNLYNIKSPYGRENFISHLENDTIKGFKVDFLYKEEYDMGKLKSKKEFKPKGLKVYKEEYENQDTIQKTREEMHRKGFRLQYVDGGGEFQLTHNNFRRPDGTGYFWCIEYMDYKRGYQDGLF